MLRGLRRVARDAGAAAVHHTQVVVCGRIPLRGGFAVPVQCLVQVARRARRHAEEVAQIELGPHMPLLCGTGVPVLRLRPVRRYLLGA